MRSSTSITLLFVTSFLAVSGFEAFNHRRQDYLRRADRNNDPYSTTQPFYHSGGYPYYYGSQYHHWWYFGSGWHSHGVYGSSSIGHGARSGTSRGGFGSTGHGHGSGS
ncbi:MAG TPA: hypothetical protein VG326_19100 [Tepidisphaeraceae bacterium]|nr:hypothetical protein [Tepidisphaeraceae bacterium]